MGSINNLNKSNRLIVLIPDSLAGNLNLTRRIYWMALRDRCDVLYLALVDQDENMFSVARGMATMKAMTSGDHFVVNSMSVKTAYWLGTLREVYQPGDRIVCHEEQSVKNCFLHTMPIGEFLKAELDAPIITISGLYHPQQIQIRRWYDLLTLWLGYLLILAIFTVLEIQLDQAYQGSIEKILLMMVMILEFGMILAWDNKKSQGK